MSALRRTPALARLMLACFALALGVASAAPLLRAGQGLERLCTASGEVRWIAAAGLDTAPPDETGTHGLDCALCLPPLAAPPPLPHWPAMACAPAADAPRARHEAHAPPLSRAPFPPRAPPYAR